MTTNEAAGMNDSEALAAAFAQKDEPALGSELITRRSGYAHHGIYAGNGMVIHYAGFAKSFRSGPVEMVAFAQFAAGHEVIVRQHPTARFFGMEAVSRAQSRLGEDRYRLLTNNCEHFVTWCLHGQARSQQVRACFIRPRAAIQAIAGFARAYLNHRAASMNAALAV
jgi:hypothetical protein